MSQPISEAGGSFGRVSLVDVDRPVAAHAHPQCHALFKVGGADSVFEVDGRRCPLAEGVGVLVNAWQPHSYPLPAGTQVLALYIEPAWLTRFDASFAAAARRDFFYRRRSRSRQRRRSWFLPWRKNCVARVLTRSAPCVCSSC
jgi:AraC family transcriptional regulator